MNTEFVQRLKLFDQAFLGQAQKPSLRMSEPKGDDLSKALEATCMAADSLVQWIRCNGRIRRFVSLNKEYNL